MALIKSIPSINDLILTVANFIGLAATIIIFIGILHGLFLAARLIKQHHSGEFGCVRLIVGQYLLLALEFLIGKDILETIIKPDFSELGALVVLIVIRITLNYFLILDLEDKHQVLRDIFPKKKK